MEPKPLSRSSSRLLEYSPLTKESAGCIDVLTIVNIHWINLTRCLHHPQSCHRQCCLLEENPSFPSLPNEPSPHPRFLLFPLFLLFPIHLPHHLASPLLFHCHPFLPFPRSAGKIFSALLDPAPCQSNNVDFQNEIKEKLKTLERRWSFCWQAVLSIPGPLSDTSYLQIKNVRKNSTHLKTEFLRKPNRENPALPTTRGDIGSSWRYSFGWKIDLQYSLFVLQ